MKESTPAFNSTHSKHAKRINRHKKTIAVLTEAVMIRNAHIAQYDRLIRSMIKDGRLTKEELKAAIISKEKNKALLYEKNNKK